MLKRFETKPVRHPTRARSLASVLAWATLAGVAVAADEPATRPSSAASGPDLSGKSESVLVPFANKVSFDKLAVMRCRVSIDGGPPVTFLVDTGSVGIIVSADRVPNIAPDAEEGSIVYSSSGIGLYGVWTPVTITFLDAKNADGSPVTSRVNILAAKERRITPGAVNSSTKPVSTAPVANPQVFMMGIGFGRGKEPHQERNPFVNLAQMEAGTMRRGYEITRDGFRLGLSQAGVGEGYIYQKLKEKVPSTQMAEMKPGLKDWDNARGRVVIDGVSEPDAAVLLDTGLTNMIIGRQEPIEGKTIQPIPDGTPITVLLQDGKLRYSFTAGDPKNPTTPRKVDMVKRADAPTLNTGLKALALFDYLYDAEGGYLGLRPTPAPVPSTAPAATRSTVRRPARPAAARPTSRPTNGR